jgi:uncharacterized iron-regulated membrane protein
MNSLKILKRFHLYLGLSVGLISSFSGITGALYIWQPELTTILSPKLFTIGNNTNTSYTDILKTVHKIEEKQNDSILTINLPYRKQQSISVSYTNNNTLYYHPKTGQYIGSNSKVISFFKTLLKLHRNLGIDGWGKYIIGSSALIFSFIILSTGLVMWYNIYKKKLKNGLKINWSSKKKSFNFNVHKVTGIYFILPLFIMATTGGYFTFNKQYKQVLNTIPYFNQISFSSLKLPKVGDSLSLNTLTSQLYPTYKLRTINYPTSTKPNYKYRFVNNIVINSGLRKATDISTTKNLNITKITSYNSDTLTNKITAQMYPIHIGESFGILNRVFIFICGFIPLILYITGIRFYFYRKRILK